jgi:poly-gamma-glutamate capsule biosynthesis protein CapA/YwtB (metallophosphatase superfamily)
MVDPNDMMLTINGNVYVEHAVSVYRHPGFLKVVELQRSADVAFANPECSILDGYEWPSFGSGMGYAGSYLGAPPLMVDEIKWLGISALYAANNHSVDFGEQGILSTIKHLRNGGMPFAGIGASFSEAAEPCYISTPHGRVALISLADWGPREMMDLPSPWPMGYMGSDEGTWYTSRPGVNLFRYEAVFNVDRRGLDELRRLSEGLDWEKVKAGRSVGGGQSTQPRSWPMGMDWEKDTDTDFFFMGRKFQLGDGPFGFTTVPYPEDVENLYQQIRDARRSADVVVVALHDQIHGSIVHDYIKAVSRGAIDVGADLFLCTAGAAKGVELYNGKAIVHGVHGYCFQNSQVRHVPRSLLQRKGLNPNGSAADFYRARREGHVRAEEETGLAPSSPPKYDGLVYAAIFDQRLELKEVRAYPTERGQGTLHEIPVLLDPESPLFAQVLKKEGARCAALGSPFEVREEYGVVPLK